MKYLRTFENFESQDKEELKPTAFDMQLDDYQDEYAQDEEEEESWIEEEENKSEEEVEEVTLEKKKLPAGLKAYLDKKKKGGATKTTAAKGKAKPDFLDLDKDGDKKESMKKAASEAKAKRK